MSQIVLLGNPGTKRAVYLLKAAGQEGVPVKLLDWKDWERHLPEEKLFLKIDPPQWSSSALGDLGHLTDNYEEDLKKIACIAGERQMECLNTCSSILALLDKRGCKERLTQAELPVTELLGGKDLIRDTEQLLEEMKRQDRYQVFVKPVRGSGAAGVSAFRFQPRTGRMVLYTCALHVPGNGLMNTKRLQCFAKADEITHILDGLLRQECVVERWHSKAVHNGYAYDLRVVVQEGRIDYMLARLSKGPITNLQLNNHPLPVEELGLSLSVQEAVRHLCLQAAACFPGLRSTGIDVLLGKGGQTPRIIEMNAQGDLIYQDIYQENRIYRHQAEQMKAWLSAQKV